MAGFAELKQSLNQLIREVQQKLPAALLGRPNDDAEAERRADELTRFADRLLLLRRDLKSHQSLLSMQPRDAHTAAGWAARHRLQDVLSVQENAEKLANLINDLLKRNGLNAMQAANQIHDLFDNLFSHGEVSNALHAGNHLHGSVGAPPGQGPAHMDPIAAFDSAVPLITLACLMLRWAARSIKGR